MAHLPFILLCHCTVDGGWWRYLFSINKVKKQFFFHHKQLQELSSIYIFCTRQVDFDDDRIIVVNLNLENYLTKVCRKKAVIYTEIKVKNTDQSPHGTNYQHVGSKTRSRCRSRPRCQSCNKKKKKAESKRNLGSCPALIKPPSQFPRRILWKNNKRDKKRHGFLDKSKKLCHKIQQASDTFASFFFNPVTQFCELFIVFSSVCLLLRNSGFHSKNLVSNGVS